MSDERHAASRSSNTADAQKAKLDALYRNQEAIEPPSGLDRIIRARAEQALQDDSKARPLPWMGGLATAAVLVLAVAVVIQVPEPAPDLPVPETTTSQRDVTILQKEPPPQRPAPAQAPAALDRAELVGSRARSAENTAAFSEQSVAESESSARQLMSRSAADRTNDAAEAAGLKLQSAPVVEAEDIADEAADDTVSAWTKLEEAIGEGDAELARTLLERLRDQFPEDERLDEYQAQILEIESGE